MNKLLYNGNIYVRADADGAKTQAIADNAPAKLSYNGNVYVRADEAKSTYTHALNEAEKLLRQVNNWVQTQGHFSRKDASEADMISDTKALIILNKALQTYLKG